MLKNQFYLKKEKFIPEDIYNLITTIALAHWIMGNRVALSHGLILCIDSYSVQDVVRFINVLIIRYKLNCTFAISYSKIILVYILDKDLWIYYELLLVHIWNHQCYIN